ncbi:MAG: GTA-gp10 family protein [Flavobacteriaceae bacterium]|nr:GTA-gp10 family protein [Flavobacteriaceae bacterium]
MTEYIGISFDNRLYKAKADLNLICEIEDELGGCAQLLNKFSADGWKVSELIVLIHILLQGLGRNVDYMELGRHMLKEGLNSYLLAAQQFLSLVLNSKK